MDWDGTPPANPFERADDRQLVTAVVRGRPLAWPAFYARFERLMRACVRRTLRWYGVRSSDSDLEDLLSAVCLNIVKDDYRKLRMFDPGRGYRLSSWVGLIATNTAIDALRRREPEHASMDDPTGQAHEVPSGTPTPFDHLHRHEEAGLLEAAIGQLSEGDRLFLEYYFEQEMEPSMIARRMGITVATVYSRKNKVREKLRVVVGRLIAGRSEGSGRGRVGRIR
ncbi:MAG: sigma-70 family RNA polymerase sigma factor [Deltaproteobacteria bacterium]|nr:sigma-70 family RNA polymerase sigma factor [Deltaproteobacteria bacterium]